MISIIPNLYEHSIYIENFNQFMNYVPKISIKGELSEFPKKFAIIFENVSFKYIHKETYALKNLNMHINRGEKIALIGRNGSGKSSIIKLLCRLYDPTEGVIKINEEIYTNYCVSAIRNAIGIVFQETQIFSLSIAENILMRPINDIEKDRNTVLNALKVVGLYEKVMNLENDIFTNLTKEFDPYGVIFSEGEFQRLIIARVCAKESPIIILDEPFSSLDTFAEKNIYDSITEANPEKIIIFVTHRLSNVKNMDKIYYIEEGEIKEYGIHTELIELKGNYYRMYSEQVKGYAL